MANKLMANKMAVPFTIVAGGISVVTTAPLWATGISIVAVSIGVGIGVAGLGYAGYRWFTDKSSGTDLEERSDA